MSTLRANMSIQPAPPTGREFQTLSEAVNRVAAALDEHTKEERSAWWEFRTDLMRSVAEVHVTVAEIRDKDSNADEKFQLERDRRYAEVAQEREKALKIKETADLAALELAREIQVYKDEKAAQLGERFTSERGQYVTQNDLKAAIDGIAVSIKPLTDFISSQQGRKEGVSLTTGALMFVITAASMLAGLVAIVVNNWPG